MRQSLNDEQRKTNAIVAMAENFGKVISDELLDMWLQLLEPYSAQDVEFATVQVIAQYEYKTLPPFAVLKKFLDKSVKRVEPETAFKIQAQNEWDSLLQAISDLGIYNGPPADMHPVTAHVLRSMGGWQMACGWQTDKLEWKERDFLEKWRNTYNLPELMLPETPGMAGITSRPSTAKVILAHIMPDKPSELQ